LVGATTPLQLDISLSVTESATTNGYDLGTLIGDPPAAGDAAAYQNLVAAMAAFGRVGSDLSGTCASDQRDDHRTMLAAHAV